MIVYYAIGGGLGHLTRARRMLETLRIDATIVTASPYAHLTGAYPVLEVPADLEHHVDAHRAWIHALGAERLIADTFPGGIQGELCGLEMPMDYVARLLRWDEYRRAVPHDLPSFDTTWILEELEPEHDAFVRSNSNQVAKWTACVPQAGPAAPSPPYWLIVHSGPEHEVLELVSYTRELLALTEKPDRILVATRCDVALPEGFEHVDAYPAAHLFASATRIISAAGFNVMLETEAFREKHDVLPFARRFDDQYRRAARRRASLA